MLATALNPLKFPTPVGQALLVAQAITLAVATTTLTWATPGTDEVLITGDVLQVTPDASKDVLKFPAPGNLQAGVVKRILVVNIGTIPLKLQNSGGTQFASLPATSSGWVTMTSASTGLELPPSDVSMLPAATATTISVLGIMEVAVPSGAGNTDVGGAVFTRAWDLVSAKFISAGATGGSVQVKTAGGAAAVTDAMVPGNADAVTREASLANRSFAAGSGLRIVRGAGNPGGTLVLQFNPK